MKSTELKKEVKEHRNKEKKLHSIWSKIGNLFGFNKEDVIKDTIEEKEKAEGWAEETTTLEDVTTEPKQETTDEDN